VLRRVISALALIAIAATPAVARTRMLCKYTGLEIADCDEQAVPAQAMVQAEGCCDRQVTRTPGLALAGHFQELAPPALQVLPGQSQEPRLQSAPLAPRGFESVPTGPPLIRITQALLI
jgi:hypothetical protein